jgi:hypothetical protein
VSDDFDIDGCPHHRIDHIVRISCHEDLLSDECRNAPVYSEWCCGRPQCKAAVMRLVKAATGFEPVTVKKRAKAGVA